MLHRPYIRQEVRQVVENRAPKNSKGQFLDSNTHKPIEGKYDLGHKPGHEFWREAEKAEKDGLTQEQFNNKMNNPNLYHIESPHENRSHSHEMPRNAFLESVKADKATLERTNQVSREGTHNISNQSVKTGTNHGCKGGRKDGTAPSRNNASAEGCSSTGHSTSSGHTAGRNASSSGHSTAGLGSGSGTGGHGLGGQGSSGGHCSLSGAGGHGGH